MPKLIIFDMDGLMIDTERLYFEIIHGTFKKNGLEFDAATHKTIIGVNSQMCVDALLNKYHDRELLKEIFSEVDRLFIQRIECGEIPVKPGLFELFTEIEKRGIKKTVGTSTFRKTAIQILESTGIINHLEKGAFGDMVNQGKPAPDIFLKCCEQFNIHPEEALVLEDSALGVKAAVSAGVPVIFVPDLVAPDEMIESNCLAICENLLAVVNYL